LNKMKIHQTKMSKKLMSIFKLSFKMETQLLRRNQQSQE
jgi:hypothetical protein